jgi:hypothetical protein
MSQVPNGVGPAKCVEIEMSSVATRFDFDSDFDSDEHDLSNGT